MRNSDVMSYEEWEEFLSGRESIHACHDCHGSGWIEVDRGRSGLGEVPCYECWET